MGQLDTMMTEGRQQARWTKLAVLGLVMESLGPLSLIIAGTLWGLDFDEFVIFLSLASAVPLLGALLVWRFGKWAKFVGIVTALVPLGFMWWSIFAITVPGSFFDFIPALLVVPGGLIAIVACISALVAGRRGHLSPVATGGERTAIRVIVGLLLLLAVLSAILTFTGRSSVADASAADETIVNTDFQFEPRSVEVRPGQDLLIVNDDPFLHTFTIDELDIDETLTAGDEILIRVPNERGSYIFYCRPHTADPEDPDEDDMAGTIRVG